MFHAYYAGVTLGMNVAKQILVVYFSGGGFVMTRIIPALEVANLVPHLINVDNNPLLSLSGFKK